MVKKVAIILTGCGLYEGTEINEAVITMLSLEKAGINYEPYGFNRKEPAINHITQNKTFFKRNTMQESARITRGKIKNIKEINKEYYSGVVVVGGYGATKILSDFNKREVDFSIDEDFYSFASIIRDAKKPALYMCIASLLLPKIYKKPICTIGTDKKKAAMIMKIGGIHEEKLYNEFSFDEKNMIISTPAFMEAKNLAELEEGISNSVSKFSKILNN